MADCNACFLCGKSFTERKYLYTHMRKMHDTEPNTGGSVKCPQDNCSFSFNLLANLRAHVEKEHLVPIVKEEIVFQSMEGFLKWKSKEEKSASSSFVMHGGTKRVKDGNKIVYMCHRSGIFTSQSKGERKLKSKGSTKIGGHCTAAIELTLHESGICVAVYFKTHFGHELDIGFLRLSKHEKEVIAGKIAEGVPFQRILDDVRNTIHSEERERLHLLKRTDLHNIKRSFQLDVDQFHSDDEFSLDFSLSPTSQIETTSIDEAFAVLSTTKKQNDRVESDSLGTKLKAKITALLNQVDSMDTETKGTMVKEVDRLLLLVDSGYKREGPHCATKEKAKVQGIPDKPKIRPKTIIEIPTLAEKTNVADALKQTDSQVAAVHVGFDHTYVKN